MKQIEESIWEQLGPSSTGEKLIARPCLPEISSNLFSAIDSSGHRHLLILSDDPAEELNDFKSRGVKVMTRSLVIGHEKEKKYLDIECLETSGYPLLNIIGGEIAQGLRRGEETPSWLVKQIFEKWRYFWGVPPVSMLSIQEVIGLFAELWFLLEWLFPLIGKEAVAAWKGPSGNRHDFEWKNRSIEVKGSSNTRGRIFQIHGLEQLENPELGPLYFFGLSVRIEGGGANSLPEIIEKCKIGLAGKNEMLDLFDNGLLQVGYSPLHQEEYAKTRIRVVEQVLFLVEDDFPRLTPNTFFKGIPNGIERVSYEINLNSYEHRIVARNPAEMDFNKNVNHG